MTFTVLTVCTGNICRSPLAQLILGKGLADLTEVRVESAGTGALVGDGMPEPALRLAEEHGFDGRAHRARQLTETLAREAGLVLALSREHRRAIVGLAPATIRRAFTLRELANIVPAVEPELARIAATAPSPTDALREAVALAARLRGTVPPPADADDFDVVDPYRRSDATYARSYDQLAPAASVVVEFLRRAAGVAS